MADASIFNYGKSIFVADPSGSFILQVNETKNMTVGDLFNCIKKGMECKSSNLGNLLHLTKKFKSLKVKVDYDNDENVNCEQKENMAAFMESGGILSPDDDRPLHEIGVGPGAYIDIKVINP